jgi:L,D-peptidoglycan transpeptidase YkuD (ErfK/YbiS/YcfS/YnhG family)
MLSLRARIGSLALLAAGPALPAAADEACPAPLANATRLVLVVSPDMQAVSASLRRFQRDAPDAAWHAAGGAIPAVVGQAGMGWGWPFLREARPDEPVKREGDRRTPAGFYALGRPFGLAPAAFPGYLRLLPDESFCVDDPSSPLYGGIVRRAAAGNGTGGEAMWKVPLYRRGLIVGFPVDRARKGGSCVFVHVWRAPARGTVGCVALAEDGARLLQDWARIGTAAIGILPQAALDRFAPCLRGVTPLR